MEGSPFDLIIFIHGLDSSPHGTKAQYFRERYPEILIPHFVGPLEERMSFLEDILGHKGNLAIIGSSLGGLMATLYAIRYPERVSRMILLAPAINLLTEEDIGEINTPTILFHGRLDQVIPIEEVRKVSKRIFKDLLFFELEDDHNLHHTFPLLPWDRMLKQRDYGLAMPSGGTF